MASTHWDLSSLLNAADRGASLEERHLWMIHLMEWLRGLEPLQEPDQAEVGTPWPVRRLRHLLNVLDRHPEHRERVAGLLRDSLGALDATGLLADYGFSPRQGFVSELSERLRLACLPATPQTRDLGQLFPLLFRDAHDEVWIRAVDTHTVARVLHLLAPADWRAPVLESIQLLVSQIRANGLSAAMRQRMEPSRLVDRPFHQVVEAAEALRRVALDGGEPAALQQQAHYLRAVLDACRHAAASVRQHLDEFGISVDLVFQIEQMGARCERVEALLACLLSPQPAPEWRELLSDLVRVGQARRGITRLFTHHYGLLARKVTERSAETGEHYITRNRAEYREMLRKAAGGGAVIGLTTLMKFALMALTLSVFWAGFWAGVNYAASFVLVHLLHWTVATKQPAMTAPSLAAKLEGIAASEAALDAFVDEVAHLLRSQFAGIVGNIALVIPVVLACQGLAWWALGHPLIHADQALYTLHSLTLLGPTALFAAFTGVLLFASSLIAGWVENWFVYQRLDSAIAWNPRCRAWLGEARALRWATWWRCNISGLAANVSLGLMLGVVPALGTFFGLPLEVRHVTLSTGQLAAALGTLGLDLLQAPDFWWCLAAMPLVGLLNLAVSFTLAFRVAMVSRGLKVKDRGRIYQALRQRWRSAPLSFVRPPRELG